MDRQRHPPTIAPRHRAAALRARAAGFDIVYVYAAHTYLLAQFLDPRLNQRSDDYGGSIANRARLVREVLAETRDAIGDTLRRRHPHRGR